jgi:hypothetical protein
MQDIQCRICKQVASLVFDATIVNRIVVSYFHCPNCGFLQTEEPYWLEEVYSRPVNNLDTGIVQRNIQFARFTSILLFLVFDRNGVFLDYAGGSGLFSRLMRDMGFDFRWDDKYSENIFAQGFEIAKISKVELVTTFESFEHFTFPLSELNRILTYSRNVLLSTQLLPVGIPSPDSWWYYGFEHGQHVGFYRKKTLQFLAERFGLKLLSDQQGLHMFTDGRVNSLTFNLIRLLTRLAFHSYVKFRMKSRTFKDMTFLMKGQSD